MESPNFLLNAVLYKKIFYRITILECENANLIPQPLIEDFFEWIKSKAVELGLGCHHEYYYDHDETGKTCVSVKFSVETNEM